MKLGLTLGALLLSLVAGQAQAHQMYRFKVDGRTLIKDHIPAELSSQGYEVLNSQGRVVEVVAPAPTAAELAQQKTKFKAEQAHLEATAKRKEADMNLLRLYSRPEDVERVRQRKIDEVDSYIQLQRRRIEDLEGKLERAQGQAANFERQGRDIPADFRVEIAQLQDAIKTSENNIRVRQQDMDKLTQELAEQYERLRILQVYKPGTLPEDVDLNLVDKKLGH